MKIAEVEAEIKKGDCSEETMELFRRALRRVPAEGRCGHCYVTAAEIPRRCYRQAISIIEYGLSEHCDGWVDRMRSYHNMACIFEGVGDYGAAQENYNQALWAADEGKRSFYEAEYAAHLLRTELHGSGFEYTEALNNYYNVAMEADGFNRSFQKNLFYRLIAEIIIFNKNGNAEKAREAYRGARQMLKSGFAGPLTALLKGKGVEDTTGATKEAKAFLKRIGHCLKG